MIWYMLRTAPHKELWTQRELERRFECETWLPTEVRGHRVSYKSRAIKITECIMVPRMLFAAIPEPAHGDLALLWYPPSLVRDFAAVALPVPHYELSLFRAEVANLNQLERSRLEARSRKPLKKKYRQKFNSFAGVKEMLFGFKQTEEETV